jgi:hypothetical protein
MFLSLKTVISGHPPDGGRRELSLRLFRAPDKTGPSGAPRPTRRLRKRKALKPNRSPRAPSCPNIRIKGKRLSKRKVFERPVRRRAVAAERSESASQNSFLIPTSQKGGEPSNELLQDILDGSAGLPLSGSRRRLLAELKDERSGNSIGKYERLALLLAGGGAKNALHYD